jgi:hypothetical protein
MKYTLVLTATDEQGELPKYVNAYTQLSFPVDATFSTNMLVGNALRELIPILLGEVVRKFEEAEMLEEEKRLEKESPVEG